MPKQPGWSKNANGSFPANVRRMNPSNKTKYQRWCASCGGQFTPEPRAAGRQQYCGKSKCRAASKRASQRRWSSSAAGKSYHSGEAGLHRVRSWRATNPDYWRRRVEKKEAKPVERFDLREALEGFSTRDTCDALQDSWPPCAVVFVGLLARLGGGAEPHALQDSIARDLHEIIDEGRAILAALETSGRQGKHPRASESR